MDNRFYLQQAAETKKVGYNAYYDHKIAHIQGLTNFSGSRVNQEYWVHDQTDTEKDILKAKAHKKLLSFVSGKNPSGGGSRPVCSKSLHSRSTWSKHNKKQ